MEKSSKCAVCHTSFRASICAACVNHRYFGFFDNLTWFSSRIFHFPIFCFPWSLAWLVLLYGLYNKSRLCGYLCIVWNFVQVKRIQSYVGLVEEPSGDFILEIKWLACHKGVVMLSSKSWSLWSEIHLLFLQERCLMLVFFTVDQEKALSQRCWMELHNEKLARLRENLQLEVEKLQQSVKIFLLKKFNSLRIIAFELPNLNTYFLMQTKAHFGDYLAIWKRDMALSNQLTLL